MERGASELAGTLDTREVIPQALATRRGVLALLGAGVMAPAVTMALARAP